MYPLPRYSTKNLIESCRHIHYTKITSLAYHSVIPRHVYYAIEPRWQAQQAHGSALCTSSLAVCRGYIFGCSFWLISNPLYILVICVRWRYLTLIHNTTQVGRVSIFKLKHLNSIYSNIFISDIGYLFLEESIVPPQKVLQGKVLVSLFHIHISPTIQGYLTVASVPFIIRGVCSNGFLYLVLSPHWQHLLVQYV